MAGNELWEYLGGKEAQLVLTVSAGMMLCLVAAFIVGKLRSKYRESDPGVSDLMTNFRDLHLQGGLSDEEYRNIKSKLAARLREEFNQSDQAK